MPYQGRDIRRDGADSGNTPESYQCYLLFIDVKNVFSVTEISKREKEKNTQCKIGHCESCYIVGP